MFPSALPIQIHVLTAVIPNGKGDADTSTAPDIVQDIREKALVSSINKDVPHGLQIKNPFKCREVFERAGDIILQSWRRRTLKQHS